MMTVRVSIILLSGVAFGLFAPSAARADGGAVRYSGDSGDYQVTIFTEPTPLRVGPADVSVLLKNLRTGGYDTQAPVTVEIAPADRPRAVRRASATVQNATNKMFQASTVEFTQPGPWLVTVSVTGESQPETCNFEIQVAPPLPRWLNYIYWIGFPILPILLFVAREAIKQRSRN